MSCKAHVCSTTSNMDPIDKHKRCGVALGFA